MIRFLLENIRWIGGAFLLTLFSGFGQTYFISLSAGHIRSEFGLSHGGFGIIFMAATLSSAATMPFIGRIVDWYPTRKVIFIIVPAMALGCVAMAANRWAIGLVAVIYVLRLLGQGMMMQTALTSTARWFAGNRGRAFALVHLGYNFGEAAFPLVFVGLAGLFGWRGAWLSGAVFLGFFILPLLGVMIRGERTPRASDRGEVPANVPDRTPGEVIRDPFFFLLLAGLLAPSFIATSIFFHQVHLVEIRGWSLEMFASSFALMAVMNITFVLVTGNLVDRFTALRLLPVIFLPLGAACLVLGNFSQPWSAFVMMGLLGMSSGLHSTIFAAIWPEIVGLKHLGSIRSLVMSFMIFATAVGPGLTGYLIDFGIAFPLQVTFMGIYCLAVFGLMIFVYRHYTARLLATRMADG